MGISLSELLEQNKLIHFEGREQDAREILHSIGSDAAVVEQREVVYERMTCGKYLHFFAELSDHRELLDSAIEQMHLTDFLDKKLQKCTKGQRKRVVIAREILKCAEIYFLMDPLGDLDMDSRKIILSWMDNFVENKAKLITLSPSRQYTCLCPGAHYEMTDQGIRCIDREETETTEKHMEVPLISKLSVTYQDKIFLFNPEEIDYAEANDGKVYVYVHHEKYLCALKMDDLENKLSCFGFYRCHRSYLINMQKVVEIIKWTRNSYSMKLAKYEEVDIPLSKAKIQELKNLYQW